MPRIAPHSSRGEGPACGRVGEQRQQVPLVDRLEPLRVLAALCWPYGSRGTTETGSTSRYRGQREHLATVRVARVARRGGEHGPAAQRRGRVLALHCVMWRASGVLVLRVVVKTPRHVPIVRADARRRTAVHLVLVGQAVIPPGTAGQRWLVVLTACRALVLDSGSYSEHLEHSRGRPTEENDREDDDDEHSHAQRLRVVPFKAGREGHADCTTQAGPKEHHLVCVRELFAALTARMALEEVDQLGERENGSIARKDHRDGCYRDEKGFHVRRHFRSRWWRGKKGHPEIDKDKVFRQFCEGAKDVLACTLRAMRHGVVSIVLERDATKEERHDARHG